MTQAGSAILACMLISVPRVSFAMSTAVYASAALLCLSIDDVSRPSFGLKPTQFRDNIVIAARAVFRHDILIYCAIIGFFGVVSWMIQIVGQEFEGDYNLKIGACQIVVSILSFAGSTLSRKIRLHATAASIVVGTAALCFAVFSHFKTANVIMAIGLLFRGTLAVHSREKLFDNRSSEFPIATTNFLFGTMCKISQSLVLYLLSCSF